MHQFSERLAGLRSDNRRYILFAERTGVPSTSQTYPDQLFDALNEQAPAFIVEEIAAKSLPKRCHFNFLRCKRHVEIDPTETMCYFKYGQGKDIIFLARWKKLADHIEPLQLSFETVFGPAKSRRHRWIKGYMVELFCGGRLTTDTLLLMADELSDQLGRIIDLELDSQRPFLFDSWLEYPQTSSDNYLINRGDLIGPDGFGTTLNFYAQLKADAKFPLDSDALAPFENGLRFVWDRHVAESGLRERYARSIENPLTIPNLVTEVTWGERWSSSLPDLALVFWTTTELSSDDCSHLDEELVTISFQNSLSALGAILSSEELKILENDLPTTQTVLQKATSERDRLHALILNGFANYFGGVKSVEGRHYRCHLDFSSSYLNEHVIACWIKALDSLKSEYGIQRIHVDCL